MTLNHIKVQKVHYTYQQFYQEKYHCGIDGKALPEYLQDWSADFPDDKTVKLMKPSIDLAPAWSKRLDWEGDVRFVWKALELDRTILPLLLCPEDLDFSCIVVVAEVKKTEDYVYWSRIGYVRHEKEDFEEEKKSGILKLEAYTDEDWEKYGDNIALEEINSYAWRQWIGENWAEELYRRRMNYTLPFYQTEGNVFWMKDTDWVFDRDEYESMVQEYWEIETEQELRRFHPRQKFTARDCAGLISRLTRNGWRALDEHLRDYRELLLHIFASEAISEPLLQLLRKEPLPQRGVEIYCKAIELMWQYGDEAVVNVVDVTILERLSDDEALWRRFAAHISEDFQAYIHAKSPYSGNREKRS
ncbi:MAG: hypothetical protein NC548_33520 [Lachnospiraceae bacterium]|nr:hypothetical protein [Lachnospiraceae bacterium]